MKYIKFLLISTVIMCSGIVNNLSYSNPTNDQEVIEAQNLEKILAFTDEVGADFLDSSDPLNYKLNAISAKYYELYPELKQYSNKLLEYDFTCNVNKLISDIKGFYLEYVNELETKTDKLKTNTNTLKNNILEFTKIYTSAVEAFDLIPQTVDYEYSLFEQQFDCNNVKTQMNGIIELDSNIKQVTLKELITYFKNIIMTHVMDCMHGLIIYNTYEMNIRNDDNLEHTLQKFNTLILSYIPQTKMLLEGINSFFQNNASLMQDKAIQYIHDKINECNEKLERILKNINENGKAVHSENK